MWPDGKLFGSEGFKKTSRSEPAESAYLALVSKYETIVIDAKP